MKKKLPLIIVALACIAGYFFMKKRKDDVAAVVTTASPESLDSDVPPRINTIRSMEKYVDQIFKADNEINAVYPMWNSAVKNINAVAKRWCKSMYDWCLDEVNGWSFEAEREKANRNGYPLELQMVNDIAWQLYGTQNLYPNAVWKKLETKIFKLA